MEKIYNKLVRNGINKKLFEEVQEVVEASGRERLEELADIYELIRTIAELHDSSMENVARLANKKKKERVHLMKKYF